MAIQVVQFRAARRARFGAGLGGPLADSDAVADNDSVADDASLVIAAGVAYIRVRSSGDHKIAFAATGAAAVTAAADSMWEFDAGDIEYIRVHPGQYIGVAAGT